MVASYVIRSRNTESILLFIVQLFTLYYGSLIFASCAYVDGVQAFKDIFALVIQNYIYSTSRVFIIRHILTT